MPRTARALKKFQSEGKTTRKSGFSVIDFNLSAAESVEDQLLVDEQLPLQIKSISRYKTEPSKFVLEIIWHGSVFHFLNVGFIPLKLFYMIIWCPELSQASLSRPEFPWAAGQHHLSFSSGWVYFMSHCVPWSIQQGLKALLLSVIVIVLVRPEVGSTSDSQLRQPENCAEALEVCGVGPCWCQ